MKRKRRVRRRDPTPVYEVECDPVQLVAAFDEVWTLAATAAEASIAELEAAMPEVPRGPTLFDRLIDALEGENLVRGDAMAERLDRVLADARVLSKPARMQLQAKVTELRHDAALEVEMREGVHASVLERALSWEQRSKEAPAEFAAQAEERCVAARAEAAALAQELAEYRATVEQLDAIYAWLDAIDRH